jgi:hypothetical protein
MYVCGFCHKLGTFVRVGNAYFHADCPKRIMPFSDKERGIAQNDKDILDK